MRLLLFTQRTCSISLEAHVLTPACSMLDVKDANNLKVPLAIFPSKDEPLDEVSLRARSTMMHLLTFA